MSAAYVTKVVQHLQGAGRWTEPPAGVPEGQWADAIMMGLLVLQ